MEKLLSERHKWHRMTDTVWNLGITYGTTTRRVVATIRIVEDSYDWDIVGIPYLEGRTMTLAEALAAVNYIFTDDIPENIIDMRNLEDGT